jgi:hypothetical protein
MREGSSDWKASAEISYLPAANLRQVIVVAMHWLRLFAVLLASLFAGGCPLERSGLAAANNDPNFTGCFERRDASGSRSSSIIIAHEEGLLRGTGDGFLAGLPSIWSFTGTIRARTGEGPMGIGTAVIIATREVPDGLDVHHLLVRLMPDRSRLDLKSSPSVSPTEADWETAGDWAEHLPCR